MVYYFGKSTRLFKILFVFFCLLFPAIFFQNCSKTNFETFSSPSVADELTNETSDSPLSSETQCPWTLPSQIEFIIGKTSSFDLSTTLPTCLVKGGQFALDSNSNNLTDGLTLSESGQLSILSENIQDTSGFVFQYSEPGKSGKLIKSTPVNISIRQSSGLIIDSLAVGEWYEVPNSSLHALRPSNNVGGNFGGIMDAWSGGAFDTKRDRLIIWGGGHADYAGNEIYTFDLNTLSWSRLIEPSYVDRSISEFRSGYYTDGLPVSRHTYNSIQYIPDPVDRFCGFGGAGLWESGQYGTATVDCFNFTSNSWEIQKFESTTSITIGATTAYDPVTHKIFQHGGYGYTGLSSLNLTSKKWTRLWENFNNIGGVYGYYKTAEIDPIQRLMISVGGGAVYVNSIDKGYPNTGVKTTTHGPQDIVTSASPGFVYVPDLKKIVAWKGGRDTFHLDVSTMTWKLVSPPLSNTTSPPTQIGTGVFGRFRYSPNKKVLVLVTSTRSNVFLMKIK